VSGFTRWERLGIKARNAWADFRDWLFDFLVYHGLR
jgi:hypothetical protein